MKVIEKKYFLIQCKILQNSLAVYFLLHCKKLHTWNWTVELKIKIFVEIYNKLFTLLRYYQHILENIQKSIWISDCNYFKLLISFVIFFFNNCLLNVFEQYFIVFKNFITVFLTIYLFYYVRFVKLFCHTIINFKF